MSKDKIIFVEESDILDYDNFICPKCNSKLVDKDYKINLMTLLLMGLAFVFGLLVGGALLL